MKCDTMIRGRSNALFGEGMPQRNPTPHRGGTVLDNVNAGGVKNE